MKAAEIVLAAISACCGIAASLLAVKDKTRAAAYIGGLGLFLCNVIWLMRL